MPRFAFTKNMRVSSLSTLGVLRHARPACHYGTPLTCHGDVNDVRLRKESSDASDLEVISNDTSCSHDLVRPDLNEKSVSPPAMAAKQQAESYRYRIRRSSLFQGAEVTMDKDKKDRLVEPFA